VISPGAYPPKTASIWTHDPEVLVARIAPPILPFIQHASAKLPTIAILVTVADGRLISAVSSDISEAVGVVAAGAVAVGAGTGVAVGAGVGVFTGAHAGVTTDLRPNGQAARALVDVPPAKSTRMHTIRTPAEAMMSAFFISTHHPLTMVQE